MQRHWKGSLIAWWIWMPAIYLIMQVAARLIFEGFPLRQDLDQFMMANFFSWSVLLWIWLGIGFVGTAAIAAAVEHGPVFVVAGLLAVVSFGMAIYAGISTDKKFARYYANSTVYYVEDINSPPDSLQRLTDTAQPGVRNCDLEGTHDVPSCVREGSLPEQGWEPRVASLSGATRILTRTAEDTQGVSLDQNTMTYLNASDDQPARWSGVLDGSGINQPMGGVAEWKGQGDAELCRFEGAYAIDRAFAGGRSKSLSNLLAEKFPDVVYEMSDVWGYCDQSVEGPAEPIVVIPVTRQHYWQGRTVDTAAGVITVRGKDGKTSLEHLRSVEPGQFPGPVYPASLAATHRVQSDWSAGRESLDRETFGFSITDSLAQGGNVSEYLFKEAESGRLVWVTPMTLAKSGANSFVAYAVVYADEVRDNKLNQLSVYALPRDDRRIVNIDTLQTTAQNYMVSNAGLFRANGGELVEFIPVNGDVWRAFGEMNGQVQYQLDITQDLRVTPVLTRVNEEGTPGATDPGTEPQQPGTPPVDGSVPATGCGLPVDQLAPEQLRTCAQQFLDELARQAQAVN